MGGRKEGREGGIGRECGWEGGREGERSTDKQAGKAARQRYEPLQLRNNIVCQEERESMKEGDSQVYSQLRKKRGLADARARKSAD